LCVAIVLQKVKVEVQRSKFDEVHSVIFIDDLFATGGELFDM